MVKQQSNHKSRRIVITLVGVVLVAALATGSWIVVAQHNDRGSATSQSGAGPVLLKPSGAHTQYRNAAFGYALQYPAEWGLNVSDEEAYMNVYVRLVQGGPGLPGFEITCADNPSGLTAQQWWQAHVSTANHETPLGPMTLASGTSAYKSTGRGSQPYELYTMVHAGKACQLVNDQHGATQVTEEALAAINTFRWN